MAHPGQEPSMSASKPAPRRSALAGIVATLACCTDRREPPDPVAPILELGSRDWAQACRTLDGLPDELIQLQALEALVFQGSQEIIDLNACCAQLRSPRVVARCQVLGRRPHLYYADPERMRLMAQADREDVPREDCGTPCDASWTELECAEHAIALAMRDKSADMVAPCDCLRQPIARHECLFLAAESLVARDGGAALPQAVAVCQRALLFKEDCLAHLVQPLAAAPPSMISVEAWDGMTNTAEQVRQAFEGTPWPGSAEAVHAFWSFSLRRAFESDARFSGSLHGQLPPEAQAHLRATLAWVLISQRSADTLQGWADHLQELLVDGQQQAPPFPRFEPRGGGRFPVVLNGPDTLGLIPYLADGRRTSSSDSGTDAAICMLEALARLRPEQRGPFEEALHSEDEVLKATAERLLGVLEGG